MHNQMRFQTRFRFAIFIIIMVIIMGLFAFTPTMAESGVIKLSEIHALGGNVNSFEISTDNQWVVYLADQDTDEVKELYSVLVNGIGSPIKLNTPLVLGKEVREDFKISADSNRVVYLTDQDTDDVFELYSVPINGSTLPVKLNSPLVSGYGVFYGYQISADSKRVVYQADQNNDYVLELYTVPIDGSAPPIQINTPMPSGHDLSSFQISSNSNSVVYRADQDTIGVHELYRVPIDGSTLPTKLNSTHVGSVNYFQISADNSQVVYDIKENLMGYVTELYSVPIDGSAVPIKLNETLGPGGTLGSYFKISAGSNRVIYLSDYDYMSDPELYSVPIDGSAIPIKLNETLVSGGEVKEFQISADGSQVVYRADQDSEYVDELYSTVIDGSAVPIKLNGTLVSGGMVSNYQISADSNWVVYYADQDTNDIYEIYSVSLNGNALPVKLNNPFTGLYGVWSGYQISADSSRVVYQTDQDTYGATELYGVPLDGSTSPTKLNGTLTSGGNVRAFQISADNNWVVYTADQDVDEVIELYAYGESLVEIYTQYLPFIVTND